LRPAPSKLLLLLLATPAAAPGVQKVLEAQHSVCAQGTAAVGAHVFKCDGGARRCVKLSSASAPLSLLLLLRPSAHAGVVRLAVPWTRGRWWALCCCQHDKQTHAKRGGGER
jgi:hypothetical protein